MKRRVDQWGRPTANARAKAARIRRGLTRRELDRERDAVMRFIRSGGEDVHPAYEAGELLRLAEIASRDIRAAR